MGLELGINLTCDFHQAYDIDWNKLHLDENADLHDQYRDLDDSHEKSNFYKFKTIKLALKVALKTGYTKQGNFMFCPACSKFIKTAIDTDKTVLIPNPVKPTKRTSKRKLNVISK